MEELVVRVEDRPGVLADVGELLGGAGINIETMCASTFGQHGIVHLVVDDGEGAAQALSAGGFPVFGARQVLKVTLDDRPGELGRYCRKLAAAGVSIAAAYVTRREGGETELVVAVDDVTAAEHA